jgi:hypothetical protein
LARMLRNSLQGSDKDLTATILWIFGSPDVPGWALGHPSGRRQHEKTDISAALPALILTLDHPDPGTRSWAANDIGAIGPKAAVAVPKLVALLDDGGWGVPGSACNGLRGIDPLPALRRQARFDPNPDKQEFAQRAVGSIENKCFGADREIPGPPARTVLETDPKPEIAGVVGQPEESPCNAPPYGDTPAAFKAFAKPYVSISLGPVKQVLRDVCVVKTHPKGNRVGFSVGLSDQDIDTLGTVALAEKQLLAIVKAAPCQDPQGPVIIGRLCPEFERRHDEPAALFLCFEPDGSCQRIPATPSTPIKTLLECGHLASFLGRNPDLSHSPERRFVVRGAGAWYECRTETVSEGLEEKLGAVLRALGMR